LTGFLLCGFCDHSRQSGVKQGMTRIRIACHVLPLVLVLPLASCALFQSKATRDLHASPDFKAGYTDGCASAQDDVSTGGGNAARDEAAFAGNPAYRAGWREGASACRMLAMPGPSMTPH
jgi:hypothetical protein